MKNFLLSFFVLVGIHLLLFTSGSTFAETYYSVGSVDPTVLTNWNSARDGSGTSPSDFITTNDIFIIQGTGGGSGAPHTMTATTAWTLGTLDNPVTLTIESNATLQADASVTINGYLNMHNVATYIHNHTSGYASTILKGTEDFATGSNFIIKNSATTGPADPTNGFGNLIIDIASASGSINSSGALTNIKGNLTIIQTGGSTREFRLTGATALTLNIGGNFDLQGGIFTFGNNTANPIVNLAGNFSMSGGQLNHIATGGSSSISKIATLNFNKAGVQTFTKSGGTITANTSSFRRISFVVLSGSTLDMGANILDCASNATVDFTVNSGGTIRFGDPGGIEAEGTLATTGNIRTTASSIRSFSTGGNYEYIGAAAQITGTGLPAAVNNLTINNSSGVTLTNTLNVSYLFSILSGSSVDLGSSINHYAEYLQLAGVDQTPGTHGSTASSATYQNATYFGSIAAGILTVNGALPVELSSFVASVGKNGVLLKWITKTETNNHGWDIEMRNISSSSWSKVGFVNGAGNSNSPKEYSFAHKPNQSGKYFYRLKQIDSDGSVSYSNEVEVNVQAPQAFSLDQNYPNPFNPSTIIGYQLAAGSFVTLKVYDIIGNEIATLVNEQQEAGFYSVPFSTSEKQLANGIYIYKIQAGDFTQTKKMLLIK